MPSETVAIGLNWVGDNILALPAYKALQHRFRSEGGISLAVPPNVAPLMEATGLFRRVIPWNRGTAERVTSLRAGGFDRAVIFPNSFRAAAVCFAASIPERWGYPTDYRRLLLTHPVPRDPARGHQLDDYSALLAALGAPRAVGDVPVIRLSSSVRERGRQQLQAIGVHLDRPLFGIHAGGLYGRAKHWGDDRFVEIIRRLRAEAIDTVLLTSPSEYAQAQKIAATCNGVAMVGHDSDVLDLAAAMSHCSAVVTNDSGPLHLAAALGVPSVSIFGPTDPERTVIPGASEVIRRQLDCQPCYRRECPLRHHRCMAEVTVDEVFSVVLRLLGRTAPAQPAGATLPVS